MSYFADKINDTTELRLFIRNFRQTTHSQRIFVNLLHEFLYAVIKDASFQEENGNYMPQ